MKNRLNIKKIQRMTQWFIFVVILFPSVIFSANQEANQNNPITTHKKTGTITVVMVGIKNNTGMMRIGLFNKPENYSDMKHPAAPLAFMKGSAPIHNLQSQIIFKNVPYGVYAVKLFQDEFMTGRLKRNFFGKPLEGVGISNNAKIRTKLPSWDQATFILDKPSVTVVIQMQNF